MSTILLSDELRTKVMGAVENAYATCEQHYGRKFPRPEVRFNIRNTNGGEAWIGKNLIRLNLTFLVENEEAFIARTVPHEVAHHVAHAVYDSKPHNGKKVRPHGSEWKEVMGVLGLEPSVKHNYSITSLDIVHQKREKLSKESRRVKKILGLCRTIHKLPQKDREWLMRMLDTMGTQ